MKAWADTKKKAACWAQMKGDMATEKATVKIRTRYRESTNEWVGEIDYKANGVDGNARYTGATEEAARNAAFAAVGYNLLATTFDA